MDIRKWLEDAVPPDQSDDRNFPDLLHPPPEEPTRLGRNYRRKRRGASNDSSLIAPRPTNHRQGHAAILSRSPDDSRAAEDAATVLQSSESSRSVPDVPVKTYEKRARHKTRPDRYEPKPKKRRQERAVRKEREENQKRRVPHRSGDVGRTTGLVQSFQLKNGPKNNRLTLRPNPIAGLFKHGRASAPMTGRGGGLPDLVFNEMKFLQKPREHQDKAAEDEQPQQEPSTKDRKRPREEEISAYFSAHKRTKSKHAGVEGEPLRDVDKAHQSRESEGRPESVGNIAPTTELPKKPFLGFGSKGGEPEGRHTQVESSGYYTWSESAPNGHSYPQKRPLIAPSVDVGELSAEKRHRTYNQSAQQHGRRHEMPRRSRASGNEGESIELGEWIQTQRIRRPALVEIYQPAAPSQRSDRRHRGSVTKTTAQSLPKYISPSPHGDQIDDTYHTSDILKVRQPPGSRGYAYGSDHRYNGLNLEREKENQDPKSSATIDKLLGQAQEATLRPRFRSPSPSPRARHVPMGFAGLDRLETGNLPTERRPEPRVAAKVQPGSRQLRSWTVHSPHCERRPQSHPYQFSARLNTQQRMPMLSPHVTGGHDLATHHEQLAAVYQDDEMLDDLPDAGPIPVLNCHIYANAHQAERLAFGVDLVAQSYGNFEAQVDRSTGEQASFASVTDRAPRSSISSIRGLSIEREFHSDGRAGPKSDAFGEFVGFWKPHKLY